MTVLVLVCVGCVAVGIVLGLYLALVLLRAADSAASQYFRAEIAEILDASSSVHGLVHEIVANAHTRIAQLRMDLEGFRGAQR